MGHFPVRYVSHNLKGYISQIRISLWGQRWRTPLSTWIKYKNLTAKSLEWWLVRGNYANMCNMTWFLQVNSKNMIQIHPDSEIISDLSHFCGSIYEDLQVSHHIAREKKKSPHGEVSGVRRVRPGDWGPLRWEGGKRGHTNSWVGLRDLEYWRMAEERSCLWWFLG